MHLQPVSYLYFDLEENDHKKMASVIRGSCSLQIGGGSTASVTIFGVEFSCLSVCPVLCIFNFILYIHPNNLTILEGAYKALRLMKLLFCFKFYFAKLT